MFQRAEYKMHEMSQSQGNGYSGPKRYQTSDAAAEEMSNFSGEFESGWNEYKTQHFESE